MSCEKTGLKPYFAADFFLPVIFSPVTGVVCLGSFSIMGIPRFFRFVSERYPLINAKVESTVSPQIDNLYLDVNGIM